MKLSCASPTHSSSSHKIASQKINKKIKIENQKKKKKKKETDEYGEAQGDAIEEEPPHHDHRPHERHSQQRKKNFRNLKCLHK
jgi:23S rRNA A1618 N6-methylase RlmF